MANFEETIVDSLLSDLNTDNYLQGLLLKESFYKQFELLEKIKSDKIWFLFPPQGGVSFEVIEIQPINDQIHDDYNVAIKLFIVGRYIVIGSDLHFEVNFDAVYSGKYHYYTDSSHSIKFSDPLKLLEVNKIEKYLH